MEAKEYIVVIESGKEAQARLIARLREFKEQQKKGSIPTEIKREDVVEMYKDLRSALDGLFHELRGRVETVNVADQPGAIDKFVEGCRFLEKGEESERLVKKVKTGAYSHSDLRDLISTSLLGQVFRAVFRHTYALAKEDDEISQISLSIDQSPEQPPAWPFLRSRTRASGTEIVSDPAAGLREYLEREFKGDTSGLELVFEVRLGEAEREVGFSEAVEAILSEPKAQPVSPLVRRLSEQPAPT